ncbi:N-acyl amino acid synthase FeeM domain-containing protein [Phaeodactylibacter luteus]|uniref:N-acyl amino acid synthase FeeM catalytic core domain-containing protein n=1 Tax=Phaeodactylibacter luteus TaxID=1564516 RepID=A0A5C6S2D8_9BACT|nr:hypothetical protein [Phaeodactylibacter luteus]TXB68405.1 hypothetical protein FRY97_03230 [Phaeodactylibacter luteus]
MSANHQHLNFRPAAGPEELQRLFQLRYEGYLESHCASLVKTNELGFELESYDHCAHHLGLFLEGHYGARPIGYMRLVIDGPTQARAWVKQLAQAHGLSVPERPEGEAWPLLNNCPEQAPVQALQQEARKAGRQIAEASRFVFSPEARAAGYARFFLEAALAQAVHIYGLGGVVLACHPRHAASYLRMGFQQIVDGRNNDYQGLAASVLCIQPETVRPGLHDRLHHLASFQRRFGSVSFLPESKQFMPPISVLQQAS